MKQTFACKPFSTTSIHIIYIFILLYSCQTKIEPTQPQSTLPQAETRSKDGTIVLGKKLENPYAVPLMQKAYARLLGKAAGRVAAASPVHTTHYYVRFLPADWQQYDQLQAEDALKLYDVPFDYEVVMNGNHYHDPSVPADKPTWQYTTVPTTYIFPQGITHEILSELYLPEQDTSFLQQSASLRLAGKSVVDALVDEAMILTQNYADTVKTAPKAAGRTANYRPYGFIRVFDTRLQRLIPLVGVRMRARRWFDIRETFTNQDGYYDHTDFKRAANYALYFESYDFDVRSGVYGQAWMNGPKQDIGWSVDIWDGVDRFYAHVFRGARRYHYGEIGGLTRPQQALGYKKLKYAAMDKSGSSQGINFGNWNIAGFYPNIEIYRNNPNGVEYASDELFTTTVHETAHSTHWYTMNFGLIQYPQVSKNIQESWAIGVEWFITSMEYRERGIPNYGTETFRINASFPIDGAYQYWPLSSNPDYSCLFIDLVDNFNQDGQDFFPFGTATINDEVTGYTFAGIESTFLKHVYGTSSLRNELMAHRTIGVTEAQIDNLLRNF